MGLIKAFVGATSGTFADQWKEFFYCESLDKNILIQKGVNKINKKRSSNYKGSDNIISNGSGIAVNEGQCMIIVEQGKIVELCTEPGEYTYDKSSEPSIFAGQFSGMFKTMFKRFGYGGDTGKDQRVYYINMKEIMDNKFGTSNPVPFRVVDSNIGLDIDVSVRCFGVYSYKITNPLLFYKNVAGNVVDSMDREEIDNQLKTEFVSALQPAFGKMSALEIRPNQLVAKVAELESAMNEALSEKWKELRGIEICSIALGSVTLPKEDEDIIKNIQRQAVYKNPGMAAASIVEAQGEAMKGASKNAGGAMVGFMGLNMAQQAGGMNANSLFEMDAKNRAEGKKEASDDSWTCPSCGTKAKGKFCPECGAKRPDLKGWICPNCGKVNKGKFCEECGTKKPASEPLYRCDKCGWEPEDPHNPPKFCPECGDVFDERDIKK